MRVPENADRDFVAGCFVVEDGKLLLLKHSKLGKWLQPGGHVEEDETPDETARRETREETGIIVEFVDDFIPDTNPQNSEDLPRPFNINLHPITEDHYHCDFQFLARVKKKDEASHSHEHEGQKWFSREELKQLDELPENVREAGIRAIEYLE